VVNTVAISLPAHGGGIRRLQDSRGVTPLIAIRSGQAANTADQAVSPVFRLCRITVDSGGVKGGRRLRAPLRRGPRRPPRRLTASAALAHKRSPMQLSARQAQYYDPISVDFSAIPLTTAVRCTSLD